VFESNFSGAYEKWASLTLLAKLQSFLDSSLTFLEAKSNDSAEKGVINLN